MIRVPPDGLANAQFERDGRQPSELPGELRMIQEVPPIVTGSVIDIRLEAPWLVEGVEYRVGDLLDAPLVAATDVERLARPSPQDHSLDRRAVVLDVQPLAPVGAVAIERQRLVVERARGEERDDLLGVLPRAVV